MTYKELPKKIQERVDRWVLALKSGKYKQGTQALHTKTGEQDYFCCLGVACTIFKDELELKLTFDTNTNLYFYNGIGGVLPDILCKYLWLSTPDGTFKNYAIRSPPSLARPVIYVADLTQLNDGLRLSFTEIAHYILTEDIYANPS